MEIRSKKLIEANREAGMKKKDEKGRKRRDRGGMKREGKEAFRTPGYHRGFPRGEEGFRSPVLNGVKSIKV